MKYVVAVSGGVDSVVLLDMLANNRLQGLSLQSADIVVGHFDHGIREDSATDARFVKELAKKYNFPYETKREELGADASEEYARERRYAFLQTVADKHQAVIATAHHQDDMLETIAINISRGTGWRGLAVFGNTKIERPVLGYKKSQLYEYALVNNLEWVEDETNQTTAYLRNRLRKKMAKLSDETMTQLEDLWQKQTKVRDEIDITTQQLMTEEHATSRYFFTMIEENIAHELLRYVLMQHGISITRPQRKRMLQAIKTAQPKTVYQASKECSVEFTMRDFIVKRGL